jgi:NAD(P)-dependent dehydrogenase (short-subunit alcohol dehydrogenase family)
VTGSSSGNGRAIAVSPAAEGATVVCSDIRREAREGGYESDANTSTDELITDRRQVAVRSRQTQAATRRWRTSSTPP